MGMTFKTAISSTQLSLGRLVRLAGAAEPSGVYTICTINLAPAFVLTRLLDVLGILDAAAHARLTGPGGLYKTIPSSAMDDPESRWWSGPDGSALIGGIVAALNDAAQPQYVCALEADGRITLAPVNPKAPRPSDEPPPSTRYRHALREGRPQSGSRAAVRRPK
jgi:hypothetical protein